MLSEKNAQKKLSLLVTLALSTNGACLVPGVSSLLGESVAYAADVTIPSSDTAHSAGVDGTTETGSKDGNNVTIGESGAAGPAINGDVVGGSATADDVANNSVAINSITLGSGQSVYGGKSASGAATGNNVTIEGGILNNSSIYGGYTAGMSNSSNNTVTITATGRGWRVYGGYAAGSVIHNIVNIEGHADETVFGGRLAGSGTAERNEIHLKNAAVSGMVIGAQGNDDASVTKNIVTLENSTVGTGGNKRHVFGGFSRGANGKADGNEVTVTDTSVTGEINAGLVLGDGSASSNKVTIAGTSTIGGAVYGGHANAQGAYATTNGILEKNEVTIQDGTVEKIVCGALSAKDGTVRENKVTISGGTLKGRIYGGVSNGNGTVKNNHVVISGGIIQGVVIGGSSDGTNAVTGNTVTISGGIFSGDVKGGESWGKTTGNTVTLGADDGTYTAMLTNSDIYGGNDASDVTDNTLNVNAKNVAVKSVNNFENYNFKLNSSIGDGDTMLTLGTGGFGRTTEWNKFKVNIEGLPGGQGQPNRTIAVLKTGTANALQFSNYAARTLITDPNSDFESALRTDTGTDTATSVLLDYNRFRNNTWTYDGTTPATGDKVYGGYSSLGHTTTNNKLTVTNTNNTSLNVYGGYTAGAGDSTNNTVTIAGTSRVKQAYGGYATAANGRAEGNTVNIETGGYADNTIFGGWAKGSVVRNIVNIEGHADWSVFGGFLAGSGTAEGNEVRGNGAEVLGYVIGAQGDVDASVTKNIVTLENSTVGTSGNVRHVTGGFSRGANGKADGNEVTVTNTAVTGEITGGLVLGDGSASSNKVTIAGTSTIKGAVYGGHANAQPGYTTTNGTLEKNEVIISGGTMEKEVYGALSFGKGTARENRVTISGGTLQKAVYGGMAYDAGTAKDNHIVISGGTFQGNVIGGASDGTNAVTGNTITISGGTFSGDIKGGLSWGGGATTGNTVTLGADDGTYTATLTNSDIYGGNDTSDVTDNTLNVNAKNVAVKSVNNFENYNFKLNSSIGDGDTMLTLGSGGFGRTIDWNKFNIVLPTAGGAPTGQITLIKTNTANALQFSNYAVRDLANNPNSDFESILRTDTGTAAATSVLLNYNRFRNNEWTYNGTNPATANEVYGGISYKDGNTTEKNKITVTGTPAAGLNFVYGGKTNGAADSKENTVTIESGTVTNVYGGFVSVGSGSATGNKVTVAGGTVTNVFGGGGLDNTVTGSMSNNRVTITGGTVTGQIVGGDSRVTTSTSNNNTVTLGGGTLDGSEVWGTSYNGTVYANTDDEIKGNTLNVQAAGLTVKKIRNFEKLNFKMTDALQNGATMLELSDPGGFGKLSSDNTDIRVKWTNVTTNVPENLDTLQGKNKITLLKALASGKLKFSDYALDSKIQGNYETVTHLDANATVNPDKTADATSVELSLNRFKNGNRTLNAASTLDNNEFYAGISEYGAGTEYNHLEIDAAPAGLDAAYAGKTEGEAGGSHHNELVVKGNAGITARSFIAAGYIHNVDNTANAADNVTTLTETDAANMFTGKVFGGKTEGTGNALRNTVNVLRKVTGDIVGGYAAKGAASYNTVNLGAVDVTGDVYGGQVEPVQPNVQTRNNTINLFGTKVTGKVFGGNKEAAGNTLAVHAPGTEINDFENIENLNFYLPEGASASMPTMLKLGTDTKNIRGLKLGVGLAGGARTLKANDTLSLMKVAEKPDHTSGTLTTDDTLTNALEGQQGVSMRYKFALAKRGTDELVATVSEAKLNEATKSLVETRAAAMDFYNSGVNSLVGSGLSAAASAVAAEAAESGKAGGPASSGAATDYAAWVAQSGTSMKVKTGSYADVRGYNLNVGFARKIAQKDGTLLFGPFVEYGRGNYDSYLDDGTHGDGKTRYIGAGLLARKDGQDGTYFEGSIRAGRMKSDYTGNIAGVDTSYDISHPYYGFHLGLGRVTKLKGGASVDTYLKYFYAHQNDADATLATGETYKFDDVNSSRLRLGVRYTKGDNPENQVYAGIAWEYEFDGDARASYQGMDTPSPSLKGSSGVLELGARFAPKDSNVSYELNLNGWAGKRRGVSGGGSVNWAF
ncbi:autotransporter outer membrane beta-barrel domain-containing protein [Selenomonas sputigena]|uniref:Autotransporter outer membrane beta-barrel domain-containing protein n=1 Tax=Selenomonas sputigena TaxID=69823 RepID=A0ABV3X5D5_9FIRM